MRAAKNAGNMDTSPQSQPTKDARVAVSLFAVTMIVALLGGAVSGGEADPWYASLNKAPGTPPGYVFGLVWPVLYLMMATAAILAVRSAGDWAAARPILLAYSAQLLLNLAWSYLFFGLHAPVAALADIAALWLAIGACIYVFGRTRALAGLLLVPYLVWVTFAAYLNGWVILTN